jgi:hypothetical protein
MMLVFTLIGLALAQPSALPDGLSVLADADGNLLAYDPQGVLEGVWWGRPPTLHAQEVVGGSSDGDGGRTWSLLDRRHLHEGGAYIELRGATATLRCGSRTAPLRALSADEARRQLAGARAAPPLWERQIHAFARDDFGNYYLIDKARAPEGGRAPDDSYRVFIGWRGQMLRAPLQLVAQDSLGDVFGMPNGARRLVLDREGGRYIDGAEVRVLRRLDPVIESELLFLGLGVYQGSPHGTPCDPLHLPRR